MALRKIPKFHLISWCGNFVGKHSFCRVSGQSLQTLWKLSLSTKFSYQEFKWKCSIFSSVNHKKDFKIATPLCIAFTFFLMVNVLSSEKNTFSRDAYIDLLKSQIYHLLVICSKSVFRTSLPPWKSSSNSNCSVIH